MRPPWPVLTTHVTLCLLLAIGYLYNFLKSNIIKLCSQKIYTQEENKIRKPNIGQQIFFADIHFPRNDH